MSGSRVKESRGDTTDKKGTTVGQGVVVDIVVSTSGQPMCIVNPPMTVKGPCRAINSHQSFKLLLKENEVILLLLLLILY